MPNWKKLIVSGSDANLNTLSITNSGSTGDTLLLTATEDSSTAAPVATFKRNSSSTADADYLGQLKFKGENDANQEVVYAKITAKIQDASDGSEDGLIEFANKKAGSNNITARLRSDKLQLINGTGLEVDGQVSASSFIGDGSGLTGVTSTIVEESTVLSTFTNVATASINHGFNTKNVIISVYDENDDIFLPTRITTTDEDNVQVTFDPASTGRVVIAKGGHLVSGSVSYSQLSGTPSGLISSSAQLPSNLVSSSAQIASNISGSFTAVSASFATTIGNLTSDYNELSNVPANIVSGAAQIVTLTSHTETFSSATAVTASHGLGTKNVTVSVYTNDDFMIFPTSIKTHDTNNVYVSFNNSRSGRIVITK